MFALVAAERAELSRMIDIEITPHGDVSIVRVTGRIVDGEPAEKLKRCLRQLSEDAPADTILDLEGVTWFDSAAIGILVAHYISRNKHGKRVLLLNAGDKIRRLMDLARLSDRFGWVGSLDEADAWFGKTSD